MLRLADWLKRKYKRGKSFESQWPPCRGTKLVKLQLVENEVTMTQEQARLFQRGRECRDEDESKEGKKVKRKTICCEEIFSKTKVADGEKILLEGDAGIGKSTFCTMFASDWGRGEDYLKQFDLLLFLPLRESKIASVSSLYELLKLLHHDDKVCSAAAEDMEHNGGENVLLLADGWDELGVKCRKRDSFLYNLLVDNEILPSASVLLTSRPSVSVDLHNSCCGIDKFVEVVGFDKENVKEYIESELAGDVEKCSYILEQFENNPLIESICSVPLNCAIVCDLSHTHEKLPHTMTDLYTKIILQIVYRNIIKLPEYRNVSSLSSFKTLPTCLQAKFFKVCEFAFTAIEKNQLVFSQEQIRMFFPVGVTSVDDLLCFGLLQYMQSTLAEEVGYGRSFHFLHLTFQEYLAAYHLVQQPPDKQLEVIESHATSPHFKMLWRFFFGIGCTQPLHNGSDLSVQLSEKVITAFVRRVKDTQQLLLCHCLIESCSNSEIVAQVTQTDILEHDTGPRTAYDCAAVVSVISNTQSCDDMYIDFRDCSLGDKGVTSLVQALESGRLQIDLLDLSGNKLTEKSVKHLFSRVSDSLKSLSFLDISKNQLGASGIKALENLVRSGILSKLKRLFLAETLTSDAETNAASLASLVEGLITHCFNLSNLDLSKNHLGVSGAHSLGSSLSQDFIGKNMKPFELTLKETMLGDEGLCAFIQSMQVTNIIRKLFLKGNDIHSISILVSHIADGMMSSLTHLNLDDNPLGLDAVADIGRMLSSGNCQLKMLCLRNCQLTTLLFRSTDKVSKSDLASSTFSSDFKLTVTEMRQRLCQMPPNNTLTHLHVNRNNFNGDNIELLAGLMSLCQGLEHLYSKKCGLVSHDLELLFCRFHPALPKLEDWHLDDNGLGDESVDLIVKHLSLFPNVKGIPGLNVNSNHVKNRLGQKLEEIVAHGILSKLTGVRVVRGPAWQSGDEDGGEGHVGTVVKVGEFNGGRKVTVQWDCGNTASYYCGVDAMFELRALDKPGLKHTMFWCDSCETDPIRGYRWNCVECIDYDLCTRCYMAGKVAMNDSIKHEFECYDYHHKLLVDMVVRVPPRAGARRVQAQGMFPGAKVVRGPDWDHGEEDGGDGEIGIVKSYSRKTYLRVKVTWIVTCKSTYHKLGRNGKVELKCVTAASGGYYYPDHLPILGATKSVQQEQADMIRHMQQMDDYEEASEDDLNEEVEPSETVSDDSDGYHTASDGEEEIYHHSGQHSYMEESIDKSTVVSQSTPSGRHATIGCEQGPVFIRNHLTETGNYDPLLHGDHTDNDGPEKSTIISTSGAIREHILQDMLCLDDLKMVRTMIWDTRVKWYDLGVELEIGVSSLEVIKADNSNQSDPCFTAMLKQWLQKLDPKPTWTSLIESLKSPPVNYPHIAEEIEKRIAFH